MDGENLTGSASEFLAMMKPESDESSPDPSAVPEPEDQSLDAAADSESADEEEYDLSPDARVAAVLGEDLDDDGEVIEASTDDDDDDLDASADPHDLDAMTPEQLRELAEEALRARTEAPQQELATIQREANEAVASAQQQMEQRIEAAFQQEVILALSEPHYGRLIDEAIENNDRAAVQRIRNAQRAWEGEQRAAWAPEAKSLIEQAGTQARKQHPGVRKLFAQWLAEERKLPAKAIDTILEETDTDRMPERADWLAKIRDTKIAERRRGNQQVREEAAKRVSATRLQQPATGRPKPAKIVPLRGEIDEFMAARKRGAI